MSTMLRRFAILAVLALFVLLLTTTSTLQRLRFPLRRPQAGAQKRSCLKRRIVIALRLVCRLFNGIFLGRLCPLHAQLMAQPNTLSHQFPGELPLQQRATQSGARFSLIAENIAEGPSVSDLAHAMDAFPAAPREYPGPDMNAVGIAVVQNGKCFRRGRLLLSGRCVEPGLAGTAGQPPVRTRVQRMSALLPKHVRPAIMDRGCAGQRPLAVLRYETTDLGRLPEDIAQKLQSGQISQLRKWAHATRASPQGLRASASPSCSSPHTASNRVKSVNADHKRILACVSGWTR